MRNTLVTYRRLLHEAAGVEPADLAARGAAVGERLERERPDLVLELEGIAAGAGVPVEELLAVNARTELLAGSPVAGECTLAGVVGPAEVRLAQNWDWHPALAASTVLWTIRLEDDGWMTTVTEAGILGKLGLSSHGLAVGLNFLASTLDDGADGMPVHVLLRMVLDSCRSAAEALELLLLRTPVGASACVTIAGAEADGHALAAVELSPGGPALVWPDDAGRLVHANHFLAGPVAGADAIAHAEPASLLRRRHAQARLESGAGLEEVLRSHFPRPYGICRHEDPAVAWAERRATLISVVMDPGAGTLALAAGRPCERPFETIAPGPCPSR